MGRIDVVIPNDLEEKFRLKLIKDFGGRKGSLAKGLQEAIRLWIAESEKIRKLQEANK